MYVVVRADSYPYVSPAVGYHPRYAVAYHKMRIQQEFTQSFPELCIFLLHPEHLPGRASALSAEDYLYFVDFSKLVCGNIAALKLFAVECDALDAALYVSSIVNSDIELLAAEILDDLEAVP